MKNIHMLPTIYPSNLAYKIGNISGEECLFRRVDYSFINGSGTRNQNIYITSDEEIKEGDWVIQSNFEKTCINVVRFKYYGNGSFTFNKIILTTDTKVIADGVQPIDDDFLEWFVKNPSCEKVEVVDDWNSPRIDAYEYKIIIPKEGPKQETLEEAAERLAIESLSKNLPFSIVDFINGYRLGKERSYGEEDMNDYSNYVLMCSAEKTFKLPLQPKEWFEQFKKKSV